MSASITQGSRELIYDGTMLGCWEGRAFVDLLQWNKILIEIELVGVTYRMIH